MRRRVLVLVVCVALIAGVCWADRVVLIDGTEIKGTVTRVALGESVEVLCANREKGEAQLKAVPFWKVASIEIEDVARGPFTLLLKSGDQVSGTLLGSPLDATIKLETADGTVLSFMSEVVDELRVGVRIGSIEEPLYVSSSAADAALTPASGLGLSFSTKGIGISRDAIAWFSEDWMLLASLGLQGWWESNEINLGLSNEVTYLLRVGKVYLGLGTGALFNMTTRTWGALINARIVLPVIFLGKQSMVSLGPSFPQ